MALQVNPSAAAFRSRGAAWLGLALLSAVLQGVWSCPRDASLFQQLGESIGRAAEPFLLPASGEQRKGS